MSGYPLRFRQSGALNRLGLHTTVRRSPSILAIAAGVPLALAVSASAILTAGSLTTLSEATPPVATATPPVAPLNGTYTVGAGGNFPSLTNTGGIFEALNTLGASGNITINIVSDLSGELGSNALNEIAGGFTVLIKPSGAPRSITGSIDGALIKINGADGVTIDGSTTGATAG